MEALRQTFVKLGFKIQAEKSVFAPTREITFLGYVINSDYEGIPHGGEDYQGSINTEGYKSEP